MDKHGGGRSTNHVSRRKLNGKVARHADIIARMLGMSARMSQECYEETASVELKLHTAFADGRLAAAKFSKSRVWNNLPQRSTLTFVDTGTAPVP